LVIELVEVRASHCVCPVVPVVIKKCSGWFRGKIVHSDVKDAPKVHSDVKDAPKGIFPESYVELDPVAAKTAPAPKPAAPAPAPKPAKKTPVAKKETEKAKPAKKSKESWTPIQRMGNTLHSHYLRARVQVEHCVTLICYLMHPGTATYAFKANGKFQLGNCNNFYM
jgi:hypothetical protein